VLVSETLDVRILIRTIRKEREKGTYYEQLLPRALTPIRFRACKRNMSTS
jgi:hypothetical protein